MLTWSASVLRPSALGTQPIWKPAGTAVGDQSAFNSFAVASVPSTNTAEWPGARLVTPSSGALAEKPAGWLSIIRQPVRSTLVVPTLVSSNQSAANGLLPLPQAETSVIATCAEEVPPPDGVTVSL